MTNHCTTFKMFYCDILRRACVREYDLVPYHTRRPNCDTCEIALKPEPIDTEPTYNRVTIIPRKGVFKPRETDEE